MISDRRMNRVWYNSSTEKIIIMLESIECRQDNMTAAVVLHTVLKSIVDDPRLIECGEAKIFETATITHNGTRWVMKLEALVPRII